MTEAYRDLGGNIPDTDIPDQYFLCQVETPKVGIANQSIRREWVHTRGFNLEDAQDRDDAKAKNAVAALSWFKSRRELEGWGDDSIYSINTTLQEPPEKGHIADMPFGYHAR